ncbi:hypothetical protein ACLB2K_050247 [Fragaria x ananassa]
MNVVDKKSTKFRTELVNLIFMREMLKAAILINCDPTALSQFVEQEGIKVTPIELSQFIYNCKMSSITDVVTSIHENWFCARCMNTSKPAGEGAIVMQTATFFLVALYDDSTGSASRAMFAVDQFVWQLNRRNL